MAQHAVDVRLHKAALPWKVYIHQREVVNTECRHRAPPDRDAADEQPHHRHERDFVRHDPRTFDPREMPDCRDDERQSRKCQPAKGNRKRARAQRALNLARSMIIMPTMS